MLEEITEVASGFLAPLATTQGMLMGGLSAIGLGLVVAASFVKTMLPLRALTLSSNVFLLSGAVLAPNPIAIILFCILIPLNSYRLVEIYRLSRKVAAASRDDLSGIWLKPYMRSQRKSAGAVLFHKGDAADALFLLLEGELELVEIGKLQARGELFGEISFFSPERLRTLTARCKTDCLLLSMNESSFRQIYFQNPKFAFQVVNLISSRLSADIKRLQSELAAQRTGR